MKRLRQLSVFTLLLGALALSSCCRSGKGEVVNPIEKHRGNLEVYSTIGAMTTRAADTEWHAGDAIGLYAVNAGQAPSMTTILGNYANVKYTTPDKSGRFTAATAGINLSEGATADIVAYYPYQTAMTNGLTYNFNTSDQSNLPAIDLLYSNNVKGLTAQNSVANLHFTHQLTLVVFDITSDGTLLANSNVKLDNVIVDGTMSLANGAVTAGSSVASPTVVIREITAGKKYQGMAILPPQDLNNKKVIFTLNGVATEAQIKGITATESGHKYIVPVSFVDGQLVITGATIAPWQDGATADPIVVKPGSGTTPTPGTAEVTIATTAVNIAASGSSLSETVQITAASNVDWTATTNDAWLSLSPANGSGNGNLTITAQPNTTASPRVGTVTVAGTLRVSGASVTITVTQAAGSVTPTPTPGANLLFPSADFEDWTAFTSSLNKYGTKLMAHSANGGRNGSGAAHLTGTDADVNGYFFTTTVPADFKAGNATKIHFWIKGTSPSKSLSINVYNTNTEIQYDDKGTLKTAGYVTYNLGDVTSSGTYVATTRNAYAGSINTSDWVKITLDLVTDDGKKVILPTKAGDNLIAFKFGKSSAYDIYLDDITFE